MGGSSASARLIGRVLLSDMVDNSHLPFEGSIYLFSSELGIGDAPRPGHTTDPPLPGADGGALAFHFPPSGSSNRLRREGQQQITDRPPTTCQTGCHRRSPLTIPLPLTVVATCARLSEPHPERLMWPYEVILCPPPFQMEQLRRLLHRRPGAANEGRHALSQRQIHALHKGGIQLSTQA